MSKAVTKSLSLPSDLIPLIEQAAAREHKKFSEWIRYAALAKLGPSKTTHSRRSTPPRAA